MTAGTHILVIGGGQMGGAMARGFAASGIAPSRITLIEPSDEKCAGFEEEGFRTAPSLDALAAEYAPDVTVLAIKPQGFAGLAATLGDFYRARPVHLFISILAGTTLASLRTALGDDAPIIRVMPNTPSLIGEGVSACVALAYVSEAQRAYASTLLRAVGSVVWLESEAQLNAATALSGSGPAYMFHMLECLIDAGVAQGLSEETARALAIATMRGASGLAYASPLPLSTLRQNVTSPGGTTEAALAVLMPRLPHLIAEAMQAAIDRAEALASGS